MSLVIWSPASTHMLAGDPAAEIATQPAPADWIVLYPSTRHAHIADWTQPHAPLKTPQHRSRRRWTGHSSVPTRATTTNLANARTIFILTLAAWGLIEIINAVGHPWDSLVKTLLLAVLALGCFAVTQRSRHHRSGWLLSSAVAIGLQLRPSTTSPLLSSHRPSPPPC